VTSQAPRRVLRFAVVLEQAPLNRWQAACLKALRRSGHAQIEAVIVIGRDVPNWATLLKLIRYPLWQLTFARLRRTGCLSPAEERLPEGVPVIALQSRQAASTQEIDQAYLSALSDLELDFLLDLTDRFSTIKIPHGAHYGVWTFATDEGGSFADGTAGFCAFARDNAVVEVILQRSTQSGKSQVLRRGFWSIVPHSLARTVDAIYFGCADLPTLACTDIRADCNVARTEAELVEARNKTPGNLAVAKSFICNTHRHIVNRFLLALSFSQWNIGLLQATKLDPFTNSKATSVAWFPAQSVPRSSADPFLVRQNTSVTVLGEMMIEPNLRGVIGAWRIDRGEIVSLGPVIEEPGVHLSFPYTFRWRGELYCMPERAAAGGPIVYRAVDFPFHWERVAHLLPEVEATDPVVFEYGGYWWLACTDHAAGRQSHLLLWYASEPFGRWYPHVLNPVRIDPRYSRGAGAPFIHNGSLIRPAQDCSKSYGSRVVFNRIVSLTPERYEEVVVGDLIPDLCGDYPAGLHTISMDGELIVVDGLRIVFDPIGWLRTIRRRRVETVRRQRAEHYGPA
jgi:hypothetical protein